MSPPLSVDDLLRSTRIAAASPGVREAVRAVALTALRTRLLTAAHIAAVAKTIGEGIGSVDVTPTAPVRDTLRGAWLGLEDALGEALRALEAAAREFSEGRAGLTPQEQERLLADFAQLERSLAIGWDHRQRIPDSLRAGVAAVTGHLRQANASERPDASGDALDAAWQFSSVASGLLRGPGEMPGHPPGH